jgi:hypothetical protein
MVNQQSPADRFHDGPPSGDEEVAKLRLKLSHKSLEELLEEGLVEIDRENEVIVKGPHFERGRPFKE